MLRARVLWTSLLVLLSALQPAYAQVHPSVAPSVIERENELPLPTPSNENQKLPTIPKQPATKPSVDFSKTFRLGDIKITGMTVYPVDYFQALYKKKIGTTVSLKEIHDIAQDITRQYRKDGYILSRAVLPKQQVGDDGVITIRVIEGSVDSYVLQGGSDSKILPLITEYAEKIKTEKPLTAKTLERYILLINDLAGTSAHATLKPSKLTDGGAELVLDLHYKMFGGVLDTNNHSTPYLGPWQQSATVYMDDALDMYERIMVRGLVADPSTKEVLGAAQYEQPIDSEGTKLVFSATRVRSHPNSSLQPLGLGGDTDDLAVSALHPFIRSRAENLTGRLTFDAAEETTTEFDGGEQLNHDRVRSLRAGVAFDTTDALSGANVANAEVSKGLPIMGATDDGAGRSVTNGDQEYTKIKGDISRTQPLPYKFSVLTAVEGQYAFEPLLTSEQFLLGGADYGRAYDPAELVGDSGLAGKVELQYTDGVNNPVINDVLKSYQPFVYYDLGTVWLNQPLAGESNQSSLASTGLGVRLGLLDNINGSIEADKPLTKEVTSTGDNGTRVFADINWRF